MAKLHTSRYDGPMTDDALYGLVEAGGTKFMLGLARADGTLVDQARIDTMRPDETIPAAIAWLRHATLLHGAPKAVGIASFGPLSLDRASLDWGSITRTTKPHWDHVSVAPPFAEAFGCPVGFDTDVNGAALAESRWGAAQDHIVSVYVTIGTGIGGGAVIDGRALHGRGHPEMGHFHPPRHPADRDFAGICPFHGDCYEGLASGPAIAARWGTSLSQLPHDHVAHDVIAHYLAHLAVALQAVLSPGIIVMGGGVSATPGLIDRARRLTNVMAKSYFDDAPIAIALPGLGDRAGLLGALALALDAAG